MVTTQPVSRPYFAFMLRMWRVDEKHVAWRVTLEEARTGERYAFRDLNLMLRFLVERANSYSEAGPHTDATCTPDSQA